jgi:hypothetical protein
MTINLVETKTKLFFNSELKTISQNNFYKKSLIINIVIFICFSFFISGILYYKYTTKKTIKKVDDIQVRKYLLEKMRQFNKNEIKSDLITNLPTYNNDYNSRIL